MDMRNSVGKDYGDILELAHHVSKTHPQMSREKRAAQFAPFAALTGYDGKVKERARLTENERKVAKDRAEELEWALEELDQRLKNGEEVQVAVTYFVPDEKKTGGAYETVKDRVKKIDHEKRCIVFMNGRKLEVDFIYEIDFT